MSQIFQPGDFLIFQIESGYGLLRVLAVDESSNSRVWHLSAFNDLFLDVEMVDAALDNYTLLSISHPHIALTDRAFQSTQVAKMRNIPLENADILAYDNWMQEKDREINDRSIRLMLGLR